LTILCLLVREVELAKEKALVAVADGHNPHLPFDLAHGVLHLLSTLIDAYIQIQATRPCSSSISLVDATREARRVKVAAFHETSDRDVHEKGLLLCVPNAAVQKVLLSPLLMCEASLKERNHAKTGRSDNLGSVVRQKCLSVHTLNKPSRFLYNDFLAADSAQDVRRTGSSECLRSRMYGTFHMSRACSNYTRRPN
jgi:hypothetical protein